MLTRARDNIFDKHRLISESRFINKMCLFSVRNDKICSEQRSMFVKVFEDDTCILNISKNIFGF